MENRIEQNVIFELCKICDNNKEILEKLLTPELDYPYTLGHLMFNRVATLAYVKLKEYDLLKRLNREFVNSLKGIYDSSKTIADGFKTFLSSLSYTLDGETRPFALLKGSFLSTLYPYGTRISNDVDLLINKEDITYFVDKFKSNGYEQGFIRGGEFVPASRKDIIESRMNNGETVPLIKESGLSNLKYFEIDLNFSLDHKAKQENDMVSVLLQGRENLIETYKKTLPTLCTADFFIYLCLHLYKEATVYDWVRLERDMTLYKFVDIYLFLKKFGDRTFSEELVEKIKAYGFEKECYYAIVNTCRLFDIYESNIDDLLKKIAPDDLSYLNRVIFPAEKRVYTYNVDVKEWCFLNNRKDYLSEARI